MYRSSSQELMASPVVQHNWSPPEVWDRWAYFDYLMRLQSTLGSLATARR